TRARASQPAREQPRARAWRQEWRVPAVARWAMLLSARRLPSLPAVSPSLRRDVPLGYSARLIKGVLLVVGVDGLEILSGRRAPDLAAPFGQDVVAVVGPPRLVAVVEGL